MSKWKFMLDNNFASLQVEIIQIKTFHRRILRFFVSSASTTSTLERRERNLHNKNNNFELLLVLCCDSEFSQHSKKIYTFDIDVHKTATKSAEKQLQSSLRWSNEFFTMNFASREFSLHDGWLNQFLIFIFIWIYTLLFYFDLPLQREIVKLCQVDSSTQKRIFVAKRKLNTSQIITKEKKKKKSRESL